MALDLYDPECESAYGGTMNNFADHCCLGSLFSYMGYYNSARCIKVRHDHQQAIEENRRKSAPGQADHGTTPADPSTRKEYV